MRGKKDKEFFILKKPNGFTYCLSNDQWSARADSYETWARNPSRKLFLRFHSDKIRYRFLSDLYKIF